jgi:hypothetical protein
MPYIDWSGNEIEDAEGDNEKLARRDREAAKLPQPGERHNASSIPVSDVALAALLSLAQQGRALAPCSVADCENCNVHNLIWWDCCNALDRSTRIALQAWLVAEGYGLPDAPWEDVDMEGNPYPRAYFGIHE